MKTVSNIINLPNHKLMEGEYGVEIEVEGERLPNALRNWRVEYDGSLKTAEAFEYVMPTPRSIEEVKESLQELEEAFEDSESEFYESVRAGVHVHMNAQRFTVKELFTFIIGYYLLEDMLLRWCGDHRNGNLFALGTSHAEGVLFNLLDCVQERNLKHLNTENIRYASLNLYSLFKYGSIEFRSMRSTPDLELIYQWVKIVDDLKNGMKSWNNPSEVILSMSGEGEDVFLRRALPETHHLFEEMFSSQEIENFVSKAARRVQMVAFGTDWDEVERKSNNPFKQTNRDF